MISSLCLGTDRKPTSERNKADYTMLDTSGMFTIGQIRDLRLSEMGEILDITYRGMNFTVDEASQFDDISNEILENLLYLQNAHRRIRPLGGTGTPFSTCILSDYSLPSPICSGSET